MNFFEALKGQRDAQAQLKSERTQEQKQRAQTERDEYIAQLEEFKRLKTLSEGYMIESGLLVKEKSKDDPSTKPENEENEPIEDKVRRIGIIATAQYYDKQLKKRNNRYVKRVAGVDFKTIVSHDPTDTAIVFERWSTNIYGHFYQAWVFGVVVKPTGEISFQPTKQGSTTLQLEEWRANPSLVQEAFGKAYSNPKLIEYWKA